jgi:hypothetical protein
MKFLEFVPSVLQNAGSVASYRKYASIRNKTQKRIAKEVEYWAIEACVGKDQTEIRIVLHKTKGAERISFCSVMKKKRTIKQKSPPLK